MNDLRVSLACILAILMMILAGGVLYAGGFSVFWGPYSAKPWALLLTTVAVMIAFIWTGRKT